MRTYTVQRGDTLSSISLSFFNDTKYFKDIMIENKIADADLIKIGTVLTIPDIKTELLSIEQLTKICGSKKNADKFFNSIVKTYKNYKINTPLRLCHFLAQALHESCDFRYMEEIASGSAYEGRKDLGNIYKGDGKKFKGRGIFQLTGRSNYALYSKHRGIDFVSNPELISAEPVYCVDVAGWYWDTKCLNKYADRDDIKTITKKINGGYNGLEDRIKKLTTCKAVIKEIDR